MKFRPCIDLHQGQVKQIVGSTLATIQDPLHPKNSSSSAPGNDRQGAEEPPPPVTNFATTRPAADFAALYRRDGLTGGHVIMLDRDPATLEAARSALSAWPGQLQIGGGMTDENSAAWLAPTSGPLGSEDTAAAGGASQVIVTSYLFDQGVLRLDRLERLVQVVGGKDRLVLDLSCRKKPPHLRKQDQEEEDDDYYYVVTDKWQKFTDTRLTPDTMQLLGQYCSEFLVHGVDVEGKQCGILTDLVQWLGQHSPIPVTYAGGVRSLEDLDLVARLGQGRVDATVGSALDIFGGPLKYDDVVAWHHAQQAQKQQQPGEGQSS